MERTLDCEPEKTAVPALVTPSPRELLFHRIESKKALVLKQKAEEECISLKREAKEQDAVLKRHGQAALRKIAEARFYFSANDLRDFSEREFEEFCVVVYETSCRIARIYGSLLGGFIALTILSWFIGPTRLTVITSMSAFFGLILFLVRAMHFDNFRSRCEGEGVFLRSLFWRGAKYFRFMKYFKKLSKRMPVKEVCASLRKSLDEY